LFGELRSGLRARLFCPLLPLLPCPLLSPEFDQLFHGLCRLLFAPLPSRLPGISPCPLRSRSQAPLLST